MKILITTEWYAPTINGVVTSIVNLEKELNRLGHEVRILRYQIETDLIEEIMLHIFVRLVQEKYIQV